MLDWLNGKVPGLYEGSVLPPIEPTKPIIGTLFKLKGHDGEVLYVFEGSKWVRVEDYVELAARTICAFSTEDRLRALAYLGNRFCFHCGRNHREDGLPLGTEPVPLFEQPCQCWNDS
jgi:hypothetical protein